MFPKNIINWRPRYQFFITYKILNRNNIIVSTFYYRVHIVFTSVHSIFVSEMNTNSCTETIINYTISLIQQKYIFSSALDVAVYNRSLYYCSIVTDFFHLRLIPLKKQHKFIKIPNSRSTFVSLSSKFFIF